MSSSVALRRLAQLLNPARGVGAALLVIDRVIELFEAEASVSVEVQVVAK